MSWRDMALPLLRAALERARDERRVAELAQRAGVHHGTLYRWEAREREPTAPAALAVGEAAYRMGLLRPEEWEVLRAAIPPLARWAAEHGVTAQALAAAADVHEVTAYRWLAGVMEPSDAARAAVRRWARANRWAPPWEESDAA